MSDVLSEICTRKREHIAACKRTIPESSLLEQLEGAPAVRPFRRAIEAKIQSRGIGLIAEVKKASPSQGIIRSDFDPASIAQAYAANGATCLSVLTDEPYFQGKPEYLKAARAACNLPVLRKDFMLDPYQVYEARAMGADCILLILAALENEQARELEAIAHRLGMDVLAEVHDEAELERALNFLATSLVGVNNRNLKTLEVNLSTSEMLAPKIIAHHRIGVCESGIATPADIVRMRAVGVHSFLVGESLMREHDIGAATRALLSPGT